LSSGSQFSRIPAFTSYPFKNTDGVIRFVLFIFSSFLLMLLQSKFLRKNMPRELFYMKSVSASISMFILSHIFVKGFYVAIGRVFLNKNWEFTLDGFGEYLLTGIIIGLIAGLFFLKRND